MKAEKNLRFFQVFWGNNVFIQCIPAECHNGWKLCSREHEL